MQTLTTQEVICYGCHRLVHVTPERARCDHCQSNLHALIAPDFARAYYYNRANQFSEQGETKLALAEANRGLSQFENSELRLLAAILARQAGDFDQMRLHVAAIPIDNTLRSEAEWLLRSQYTPERKQLRQIEDNATNAVAAQSRASASRRVGLQLGLGVLVSLSLLVLVWNLWRQTPIAVSTPATPIPDSTPIPQLTTPTPITPLLPVPTLPNGQALVNADAADDKVVANATDSLLESAPVFDIQSALTALGRTDLANLLITGRLDEEKLLLSGTVGTASERAALIEVGRTISGVTEVDALNLFVRVPATYTVQSGDTLWSIVYKFYGDDSQRVAQIYEFNKDIMVSANDLRLEMELKLPPNQ